MFFLTLVWIKGLSFKISYWIFRYEKTGSQSLREKTGPFPWYKTLSHDLSGVQEILSDVEFKTQSSVNELFLKIQPSAPEVGQIIYRGLSGS